jgi:hypothetical protein
LDHSILPTFRFPVGTRIAQAVPPMGQPVTMASPGRSMIYQGVRLLFVVSDMPNVEGLITSTDLEGERPMQVIGQRGVKYEDLRVVDVMSPLGELDAIGLEELAHADVAKVVATLKRLGRRHMLVVQQAGSHHGPQVRGVISQSQIERQLGQSIELVEVAGNFAEISASLAA